MLVLEISFLCCQAKMFWKRCSNILFTKSLTHVDQRSAQTIRTVYLGVYNLMCVCLLLRILGDCEIQIKVE